MYVLYVNDQGPPVTDPTAEDLRRNQSAPVRYSPAPPAEAEMGMGMAGGQVGSRPPSNYGHYEPSARRQQTQQTVQGLAAYSSQLSRRQFGSTPALPTAGQLKSEQILRESYAALQRMACLTLFPHCPLYSIALSHSCRPLSTSLTHI